MAPLVPRMHLFEINDQDWFPTYFREKVQAALTLAWVLKIPYFQKTSPANVAAKQLFAHLKSSVSEYVFIDFCSGAGGPTPMIEQHLNRAIWEAAEEECIRHAESKGKQREGASSTSTSSTASPTDGLTPPEPVKFVLTDLHPHVESWETASQKSHNLGFITEPIDASQVPEKLITEYSKHGYKIFRLFNLAFHHFDDPLALAILKDTIETSNGFGIFELQTRDFTSFLTCLVFGLGIIILAPYYAYVWHSLPALFFVYLIPIIPFVLVFDGWVSALRTRTPEEVEVLLRACQKETGDKAVWEIHSGKEMFFWPVGYLHYIIALKTPPKPVR